MNFNLINNIFFNSNDVLSSIDFDTNNLNSVNGLSDFENFFKSLTTNKDFLNSIDNNTLLNKNLILGNSILENIKFEDFINNKDLIFNDKNSLNQSLDSEHQLSNTQNEYLIIEENELFKSYEDKENENILNFESEKDIKDTFNDLNSTTLSYNQEKTNNLNNNLVIDVNLFNNLNTNIKNNFILNKNSAQFNNLENTFTNTHVNKSFFNSNPNYNNPEDLNTNETINDNPNSNVDFESKLNNNLDISSNVEIMKNFETNSLIDIELEAQNLLMNNEVSEEDVFNQVKSGMISSLSGSKYVRMQLKPQGLGCVGINIKVLNGKINLEFMVDNSSVENIISENIKQLESILNSSGLLVINDISVKRRTDNKNSILYNVKSKKEEKK